MGTFLDYKLHHKLKLSKYVKFAAHSKQQTHFSEKKIRIRSFRILALNKQNHLIIRILPSSTLIKGLANKSVLIILRSKSRPFPCRKVWIWRRVIKMKQKWLRDHFSCKPLLTKLSVELLHGQFMFPFLWISRDWKIRFKFLNSTG